MNITDFSNGTHWAIVEGVLQSMRQQYAADPDAMIKAVSNFTSRPAAERDDFRLVNGVAVIPVNGPTTQRQSFLSFLFGGTSLEQLTETYLDALEDRDVQAILFHINSPGGVVAGTDAFSNLIFNSRGRKPIVAFGDGVMASAAYWYGSAADLIVVDSTCEVGSIGIVKIHDDRSKEYEQMGVKRTALSTGKYKTLGNDFEPLSELAIESFMAEMNYLDGIFLNAVSRNRGVSPEIVLKNMADGRIFIGQQAVDAGLADQTGSIDDAIAAATALVDGSTTSYHFTTGASSVAGKEYQIMEIKTVAELEKQFPELAVQLRESAVAGVDMEAATTAGASAERERVMGLVAIQFGADAGEKFKAIVDSGVTVDQFQAVSALNGAPAAGSEAAGTEAEVEAKAQKAALAAITAAGAENPGSGGQIEAAGSQDFMAMVTEYQEKKGCSRTDALKAIAAQYPDLQKQYLKAANPQGSA